MCDASNIGIMTAFSHHKAQIKCFFLTLPNSRTSTQAELRLSLLMREYTGKTYKLTRNEFFNPGSKTTNSSF